MFLAEIHPVHIPRRQSRLPIKAQNARRGFCSNNTRDLEPYQVTANYNVRAGAGQDRKFLTLQNITVAKTPVNNSAPPVQSYVFDLVTPGVTENPGISHFRQEAFSISEKMQPVHQQILRVTSPSANMQPLSSQALPFPITSNFTELATSQFNSTGDYEGRVDHTRAIDLVSPAQKNTIESSNSTNIKPSQQGLASSTSSDTFPNSPHPELGTPSPITALISPAKRSCQLRSQSYVTLRSSDSPTGVNVTFFKLSTDLPGRSRSTSRPVNPTEAFLQVLIESGTNIQYRQLEQPSATSLRTETSSVGTAYPQRLRLHRKRGYSHLAKAASEANQGVKSTSASGARTSERQHAESSAPRMSGNGAQVGVYQAGGRCISGRFPYEVGDMVSDLPASSLENQGSGYYRESTTDSRSTTGPSLGLNRGSFDQFLNDICTVWARTYYRGSHNLRLGTPPQMTEVKSQVIQIDRAHSASRLDPGTFVGTSSKPGTVRFSRRQPHENGTICSIEQGNQSSDWITSAGTATDITFTHPTSFNPTPQLPYEPDAPHLSASRRGSQKSWDWRAPSFDGSQGLLSMVNKQIVLFCVGFACPLVWILAALLPIPERPHWRRTMPGQQVGDEQVMTDHFDPQDVTQFRNARWRRTANRFMSLTGLFVIAAVIVCAVVATR